MEIEQSAATDVRLGAFFEGENARFAVRSGVAERVELCLFDGAGPHARETRIEMASDARAHDVFVCDVRGVASGQLYGYRVHGPHAPDQGHRCNAHKLLLDPYARAITGELIWSPEVFGSALDDPRAPDPRDSAPFVPRSVAIDSTFDWGADAPPRTPWSDTLIYELHVKSWSAQNARIPDELRGTYAGLAHEASIEHLRALGVTAIELMPTHAFASERALVARGLRNHWGYNTLGYFAPHAAYAADRTPGGEVRELKRAIQTLHAAGIEVLLDVVYNHTAETGDEGPTLCLRGLDNAAYYLLDQHNRARYVDWTGCGNTLNALHPHALQLILDSLRYWVREMHVDGFRFDLASALLRVGDQVDMDAPLMQHIAADPLLSQVKLIAEPWDCGAHGYQVGGFPTPWSEWNGCFRDDVREHWRGDGDALGRFVTRLRGSEDLYGGAHRLPSASINFVTSHDGFTLRDLVSYENKRNEANGEQNQDGERNNFAFNCGAEGETAEPEVLALRARQQRNLLATLFLSAGVPMLTAGDEFGRTQLGNNNAYCQDNELSWLDWAHADRELLAFVQRLSALRRAHPVLRPHDFREVVLACYRTNGLRLTLAPHDFTAARISALGIELIASALQVPSSSAAAGLYLLVNPSDFSQRFTLPAHRFRTFRHVIDTAQPERSHDREALAPHASLHVQSHALRVLEGFI